jgi:hypothetical protein
VLLLVAAAVGLAGLVVAPLAWVGAADGLDGLGALPAPLRARVDAGTVRAAVTVGTAYPAALAVAMLALVPIAVLLWRRRIPALVAGIAAGVLVAGQVLSAVVAVGVRAAVASATAGLTGCATWPACTSAGRVRLLPGRYLPACVVVAAAATALLVAAVVLLLGRRATARPRPGAPAGPPVVARPAAPRP